MYRRILLYGVTGSGKTTLARQVAEATGLPMVSVDDEVGWLPGWVERPEKDQRRLAQDIVPREAWVMDTAYGKWRDVVLPRAELVVGLDYPRWLSYGRLLRRTAGRIATRRPICNGNTETLGRALARDSILWWHVRSFGRKRERMRSWAADPDGPALVLLRTPRETQDWLATLRGSG